VWVVEGGDLRNFGYSLTLGHGCGSTNPNYWFEVKLGRIFRNITFGYAGAVHMYKVFERYVTGDCLICRDLPDKYTSENVLQKSRPLCSHY
jgi:hypothetical protein